MTRLSADQRAIDGRTYALSGAPGIACHCQQAGLYPMSIGLWRTFADDHEQLRYGMLLYDALYAWCKDDAHTSMHG
jgi:hypothetical protein